MLGRRVSAKDSLYLLAFLAAGLLFAFSVVHSGGILPASCMVQAHADDTVTDTGTQPEGTIEPTDNETDDATAEPVAPMTIVQAVGNEVKVGDMVVLRIRTTAGGLTPAERAMVIAQRLSDLVNSDQPLKPEDVHAGMMDGEAVVMGGETLIITADPEHAAMNGTTPEGLANIWATNIAEALGGDPGASMIPATIQTPVSEQAVEAQEWEPREPYRDKEVPIISVGRGFRVGIARVTGPDSQVSKVQAVAQIESNLSSFGDVEIYVPISTKVPGKTLDRVNECAVVGLADIGL